MELQKPPPSGANLAIPSDDGRQRLTIDEGRMNPQSTATGGRIRLSSVRSWPPLSSFCTVGAASRAHGSDAGSLLEFSLRGFEGNPRLVQFRP